MSENHQMNALSSTQDTSLPKDSLPKVPHRRPTGALEALLSRGPRLSPREHEVLLLLAEGYTNREIAEKIFRSIKTVETYRANIKSKLGLHSRAEIVRYVRAGAPLNRTA
jgi:DNA-binding CsgD family transcriptional regulator